MKSCGWARVDKLASSFMKKGRREAGGDDGREEDNKRERENIYCIVNWFFCFMSFYIHIV
jgi:hypothetical protein